MIIICPHCKQKLESGSSFGKFDCPCCGNGFEIQYPRASNRPPSQSKFGSIVAFLSILSLTFCVFVLLWFKPSESIEKENVSHDKVLLFKSEYMSWITNQSRDPKTLTVDWKIAGYDSRNEVFLGVCIIREKNPLDGYFNPQYVKMIGKIEGLKISFNSVQSTFDEFSKIINMSYEHFYYAEKTKAEKSYHQLELEIEKIIADAQKEIQLINLPKNSNSFNNADESVFEPPSYPETYNIVYQKSKNIQKHLLNIESNPFHTHLASSQTKEKTYQSCQRLNDFTEELKDKMVNINEDRFLQRQKEREDRFINEQKEREENLAKEEDRKHQEIILKLKQEELEKEKIKEENSRKFKKPQELEVKKGKEHPCFQCNGSGREWSFLSGNKGKIKVSCSVCDGTGTLSAETPEVPDTLKQPEPRLMSEKIRDDKTFIKEIQTLTTAISKVKNLKRYYYPYSQTHYAYGYGRTYSYMNEEEPADEKREKEAFKVAQELKALGLPSKVYYPVRSIATKYAYSMNARLRSKEVNRLADLCIEEIEKIIDSKKAELKNKKSLDEISK